MSEDKRKQFDATVREAGAARTLTFTISTAAVDRDNDTIDPAGWKLGAYQRNPVVLFAHNYEGLPVARATDVRVLDGKLVATAEFPPKSVYPFGATVFEMVRAGYLNAVSVGFRPIRAVANVERGGVDFLEQELLEFSIVPVPANAEALIVGRAADASAFRKWLRGAAADEVLELDDEIVLDLDDEPPGDHRARGHRYAGDVLDVDAREIAQAIGDTVPGMLRQELRQTVQREVRAAINRARGRVD